MKHQPVAEKLLIKDFHLFSGEGLQGWSSVSNTEVSVGLCAGAACIVPEYRDRQWSIRPVENQKFLLSLVRLLADGTFGTSQKYEIKKNVSLECPPYMVYSLVLQPKEFNVGQNKIPLFY